MSEERQTAEAFLSAVHVSQFRTLVAVTSVAMAAVGESETDSANLRGVCRSATDKRIGSRSISVARGASDTPVSPTHEAYARDIPGETLSVETLGWSGCGETNGWRYVSLDSPFSDGAARFAADSRIESPRWAGADILNVEVRLRCSTNTPNRWLQVNFLCDGKVVADPNRFDTVFAADKAETQRTSVLRECHANRVALSLSDGDVGDWGVYAVGVTVAKTTRKMKGFVVAVW